MVYWQQLITVVYVKYSWQAANHTGNWGLSTSWSSKGWKLFIFVNCQPASDVSHSSISNDCSSPGCGIYLPKSHICKVIHCHETHGHTDDGQLVAGLPRTRQGLQATSTIIIGQLILRKSIQIDATRCHILRLKCTKFDFGWGSAQDPSGGA